MSLTTELQKTKISYTPPTATLDDRLLKKELVLLVGKFNETISNLTAKTSDSSTPGELEKLSLAVSKLSDSVKSIASTLAALELKVDAIVVEEPSIVQFILPLNIPGFLTVGAYQVGFGLSGTKVDGNLILNGDAYIYGS
jgi:hypothetical protein